MFYSDFRAMEEESWRRKGMVFEKRMDGRWNEASWQKERSHSNGGFLQVFVYRLAVTDNIVYNIV